MKKVDVRLIVDIVLEEEVVDVSMEDEDMVKVAVVKIVMVAVD